MAGEHNTPVGTPILLAPGQIVLVGEYAVLDEGSAVVAAIGRYAKAQFIPRMETMPPLVAEVVARAKAHLGDMTSALPSGAVLVAADDFQLGRATGGLGPSAAIAVATAASVFESLGLDLDTHKPAILAIADAGRRRAQGEVASGSDTVASTYGGFVEVVRTKNALPAMRKLPVPTGLHVVLFSASSPLSTNDVIAGLRAHAQRDKHHFGQAVEKLKENARRFGDEATAGNAADVVRAAGDYGDELARLALAAGVSIGSDDFVRAGKLARQFGGIAKPTAAGSGAIGLAMFASPEAARAFRRACVAPVVPLDGDLDTLGVRCQVSTRVGDTQEGALSTPTPAPDDDFEDDAATTIQPFDASLMATVLPEVAPKKDTVSASPIEIQTTGDAVTIPRGTPKRPRPRRAVVSGVTLFAALAVAGWLGIGKRRDHRPLPSTSPATQPRTVTPATPARAPLPVESEHAPPIPPALPVMLPHESPSPAPQPPPVPAVAEAPQSATALPSTSASLRSAPRGQRADRFVRPAEKARTTRPQKKKQAKAGAATRAGGLSASDF